MEHHNIAADNETLGDLFRKLRMERSLDISEVSQETRIPPETVRAMEADDYSALPAMAFARGFYSIYAKMLDLDQEEIVQRFLEEHRNADIDSQTSNIYPQSQREENVGSMAERPSRTAGSIISISLLIFILAATGISWYAGYNPAKQISNWLRSFQDTPAAVEVVEPAPLPAEQKPQSGENVQEEDPATAQTPPVTASAVLEDAKYQLVAEFQEPTEIVISLDDSVPETFTIAGGSIETWLADAKIILELPVDTSVRLYLNGIVVPLPPAAQGKIVISIPEYFLE